MKSKDAKAPKSEKASKEDRKSYPLRLSKVTLKALKVRAMENDTSVQKLLEGLIDEYLRRESPSS